ncbi:hypothetical protein [Roseomonas sp. BN140053]|uniref:hypothetical protein n=1 Tax=Roseomonas sp. BN140053 TaxID=3391898 RepID=UPI0039EBB469
MAEWLALAPGEAAAPEAAASRRRVALALLEDLARGSNGRVLEDAANGALLLGGPAALLDRAEAALAPIFGAAALLRQGAAPELPRPPVAAAPGTEGRGAAAEPALRRRPIVGLSAAGVPRLAGIWLTASRRGGAALPAHLARHAAEARLRRAASELAEAEGRSELLGGAVAVPLHLDVAAGSWPELPRGLEALPVVPVLPLGALARGTPAGLFALSGLHAGLVPLCDPAALPGAALHLRWDARLASVESRVVAALGVGRIVLHGVASEDALRWGLLHGIGRFAGPHPSRLLAALRRRLCPDGGGCTAADCALRAMAAEAAGRRGCTRPERLLASPEPAA